jgi:hypothetical protein
MQIAINCEGGKKIAARAKCATCGWMVETGTDKIFKPNRD